MNATTAPVDGDTIERGLAGTRRRALIQFAATHGIFVVVAVFVVFATVSNDRFLQPDNIRNVLQIATPIAILALGQAFVLFTGNVDLSVGSIVSVGAAVLGKYMGADDAMILPVVLLAIGVGGLLGAINGGLVAYARIPSFVATLGTLLAISGAQLVWTQGAPTSNFAPSFNLVSQAGTGEIPTATLGWLIGATFIAWLLASKLAFGRRLLLIGSNARASEIAGLPVRRTVLLAYMLSGMFAAAAAVYLTSTVGSAQAQIGAGRELEAIAACVLGGISLFGGRGRIVSALGGALLLGGLFNFLVLSGAAFEVQQVLKGAVVIVAVLGYARMTRST
jgi:ribose/xylose/arabinose/galactoside ABC-type transport system permease subunit